LSGERPEAPPREVRRRAWTDAEFTALDFEATGLDFEHDTIVSLGMVPVSEGRIVMAGAVYQLVQPIVPPSPVSVTIHGLRAQDLAYAPTLDAAKATLLTALDRRFLLTWWAEVEAAFLDKVFGGGSRHWLQRSIDVRQLAMTLEHLEGRMPKQGSYTLSATASRHGVPVANPHHALDDALVTAQLFLVVATSLAGHGYKTVRSLLRAAARPVLPSRLSRFPGR
jgi:DNA polymerase-3 subunit epsilon